MDKTDNKDNKKNQEELEELETEVSADTSAEEKSESAETPDPQIQELETALAAEKDKLLRTAAEYANYRTRTEKEKSAIYTNAVSDTVKEILPIADNIERAIEASQNAPEEYRKGLELISNQLARTFEKLDITSFGEVGEQFDPEFHNAISSTDSDELESDTIAKVFQKGYKIGDKIIRHAMVQTVN